MSVPVLYCGGQLAVPECRGGRGGSGRGVTPRGAALPAARAEARRNARPPEQRCPRHRALLPVLPVGRSARPGLCTGSGGTEDCEGLAAGADPGWRAGTRCPSGITSRAGRGQHVKRNGAFPGQQSEEEAPSVRPRAAPRPVPGRAPRRCAQSGQSQSPPTLRARFLRAARAACRPRRWERRRNGREGARARPRCRPAALRGRG